ncbi:MAG: six-cysteine ranthipeptide SCIFF [Firmicutes bacterium]|nr:six-cysteine ranthipeptide SCIFF [Bacillota bacterium]
MEHIKTIFEGNLQPTDNDQTGCGECQASCQSACKTSCTVGNQPCEQQ